MSFKVQFHDNDSFFMVEEGEPILEAALRQGHNLPYGCRNGACGSCKAKIIAGEYIYPLGNPDGISDLEKKQKFALLCQANAESDLIIKARSINTTADIELRQLPCRVNTCEKLSHDVIKLLLELPKTERLQFLAGQYIDIILRDGKRRSFSLANPPHEDQLLELHIRHYDGGLFSEYAFNELKEKTVLRIEGPLGQFTLYKSERPIIMIAGGTGFAPIKSLVEYALKNNDKRNINIYWGVRKEQDLYLNKLVKDWSDRYTHINYIPVLSEIESINGWSGKTGFVHEAVLQDYKDLSEYDVYACGPPPMIKAISESFPDRGLVMEQFFSDSFEFAIN